MSRKIKKTQSHSSNWFFWLTLFVALIGGIPGVFVVKEHFSKASLKILFDEKQSLACKIQSNNQAQRDKLAILLYRLTITGKGTEPTYVRDIRLALKCGEQLYPGIKFSPKQHEQTDKNGVTEKYLRIFYKKKTSVDLIYVGSWHDFKPSDEGLSFGQPRKYSYAAYFNIHNQNYKKCDELMIIVEDYLGNRFEEKVDVRYLFQRNVDHMFLDQ